MSSRVVLKGKSPTKWPVDPVTKGGDRSVTHVSPELRFGVTIGVYCLIFTAVMVCLASYPPVFQWLVGSDELAGYHHGLLLEFTGFVMSHWWIPMLGCLIMGVASILYSYRIFSSMRHFEEALRLKQRDPNCQVNLSLRKSDYFHRFSQLLEEVLNTPVPSESPNPTVEEDRPQLELARQN